MSWTQRVKHPSKLVNEGDTVTLNFDAKTITVNGVTTALSSAITAAFEAAGVDNVTIGAGLRL